MTGCLQVKGFVSRDTGMCFSSTLKLKDQGNQRCNSQFEAEKMGGWKKRWRHKERSREIGERNEEEEGRWRGRG